MKHETLVVMMPRGIACTLGCMLAAGTATAQPVLITAPTTIGPTATTITPTAGGPAVPLATAQVTVQGATLTINGRHPLQSLSLTNGAVLNHSIATTFDYSGSGTDIVNGLWLTVSGDMLIDALSRIDVSGAGHPGSTGVGRGVSGSGPCGGGGGGHGGSGGRANCVNILGGPSNDSESQPTSFGSGGGGYPGVTSGGPGGGAIRLIVGGTLTVAGSVHADGQGPIHSSGGAGGSVWISAREVAGSGSITAIGGSEGTTNASSGGGGGGRIAITGHCTLSPQVRLVVSGGHGPDIEQTGSSGTTFILAGSNGCCPADFNGDGFADGFDYDDFVACFEGLACPPGKSADFSGDGFVDGFDYDAFVTAFETPC